MDPWPGEEGALQEVGETLVILQRIFGSQPRQLASDTVIALDHQRHRAPSFLPLARAWSQKHQLQIQRLVGPKERARDNALVAAASQRLEYRFHGGNVG